MKRQDIQQLLAAFLAGKLPQNDIVDRRQGDPMRPPGMPRATYAGGAFPPYKRGMDPGASHPRYVPQSEWFGTVGPYLPDELHPNGEETPFPVPDLIRQILQAQARTSNPVSFPPNSPLGQLQRAFGNQPNRRLGGK